MDPRTETAMKPQSRLEQDLHAVGLQLANVREQVRNLTEKTMGMRARLLGRPAEVATTNDTAGPQIARDLDNLPAARPMVGGLSSLAQAIQQDVETLSKALHTL